ncbi:LysR substrate-binding domain-containing protein [Sphingomonas sp. PsM26]|nr:LysR substrate-binding domain-containing protein [Sphingomonas sp. PsM26]
MGKLAADFALKHPAVRLEVTTDDRQDDMIEEGYDLVIRVNPAPDEALVGGTFLHDRLVVVSSPPLTRPEGGTGVHAETPQRCVRRSCRRRSSQPPAHCRRRTCTDRRP